MNSIFSMISKANDFFFFNPFEKGDEMGMGE